MGRQTVNEGVRVHAATVTAPATDIGYAYTIVSAGSEDREVLQLAYETGTNTANSLPLFWLIAPGIPRASDGTFDTSTESAFIVIQGASHALTANGLTECWPTHAKSNLAGRLIIPAQWTLVASPYETNANGTILYTCITQTVR